MASHVSRYILWARPNSAPPFPVNKNAVAPTSNSSSTSSASSGIRAAGSTPTATGSINNNTTQGHAEPSDIANGVLANDGNPTCPRAPLAPTPSAREKDDTTANAGADSNSNASSLKVGEWQAVSNGPFAVPVSAGHTSSGDAKALLVHKALADPSKWLLRNRETGEEVEATAFVEALIARRPTPQQTWCAGSPQLGSSQSQGGGWMSRRQRNNGPIYRRPTLLPYANGVGGMNVNYNSTHSLPFPTAAAPIAGPPSPPTLQLSLGEGSGGSPSQSQSQARGRSSRPADVSSRVRSDSHGRSLSGSSGAMFGASTFTRCFKLSNMSTAQIVPRLHPGGIRAVSFSPTGTFLATAGADHRCCVFRVHQRRQPVSAASAASAAGEGSATLLTAGVVSSSPATFPATALTTTALVPVLSVPAGAAATTAGDLLSSLQQQPWQDVGASSTGRLIDDEPVRVLLGHVGEIVSLSWAHNDSALLTASADGTVRCWNPREGSECSGVYEHGGGVTSVCWDPASTRVAAEEQPGCARGGRFLTGCMDGKLRLFAVDSSEAEECVLAERPVTAVAFAPGGAAFVAGFVGGSVGFYRTEGVARELTAECRRHGIRHSASQHARHATSPVRRLSAGSNGRAGSGQGSTFVGAGVGRGGNGRRRRDTIGPRTGARFSGYTEERVTGLCFRPQAKGAWSSSSTAKPEGEGGLGNAGDAVGGGGGGGSGSGGGGGGSGGGSGDNSSRQLEADSVARARAPAASVEDEAAVDSGIFSSNEGGDNQPSLVGSMADLLVSTNDSRTRVLVKGDGGNVSVGVKLKGHNTEGLLGRRTMASYSDDGELVISGSSDGNVHVWSTPTTPFGSVSRRGVARSGREGHERARVSEKSVAVPVALFAPSSVGGESSRAIVTGDDEGYLKVFIG